MHRAAHSLTITAAVAGLSVLAACGSGRENLADWDERARVDTNAWTVTTAFDNQVRNGITARRTMYQDHFVPGTASLTDRGEQEMTALAKYFSKHGGGEMYFPRDGASDNLYRLRTGALNEIASAHGVRNADLIILDGFGTSRTMPAADAVPRYREPSVEDPYTIHGGTATTTGGN